jgi:acetate kinase
MIEQTLHEQSGLLRLSEISNNVLDIEQAAAKGDYNAHLALKVFAYSVRKYIGAYAAAMAGFDVHALTGAIGENSSAMRHRICDGLNFLGVQLDFDRNQSVNLQTTEITAEHKCLDAKPMSATQVESVHTDTSHVKILVIAAQEAWMIAQMARRCLGQSTGSSTSHTETNSQKHIISTMQIPLAVSVRHAHLTQETVERLFGANYQLTPLKQLSQPGYLAAAETIDLIGPRGSIQHVRVLGPCREHNQIEVSQTETFHLGIDAPLRMSGILANTPCIKILGPKGEAETNGVIVAHRHIHMNPEDARAHGLSDNQHVSVRINHSDRDVIFHNVVIRVQPNTNNEMHIDTDEANAADITHSPEQVRTASGRWATLMDDTLD